MYWNCIQKFTQGKKDIYVWHRNKWKNINVNSSWPDWLQQKQLILCSATNASIVKRQESWLQENHSLPLGNKIKIGIFKNQRQICFWWVLEHKEYQHHRKFFSLTWQYCIVIKCSALNSAVCFGIVVVPIACSVYDSSETTECQSLPSFPVLSAVFNSRSVTTSGSSCSGLHVHHSLSHCWSLLTDFNWL